MAIIWTPQNQLGLEHHGGLARTTLATVAGRFRLARPAVDGTGYADAQCWKVGCRAGFSRGGHQRDDEGQELMGEGLRAWIDQKPRTGDGLCTRYAPEVFESGDESFAYVKDAPDQLLTEHGAQAEVPGKWRLDVVGAASTLGWQYS